MLIPKRHVASMFDVTPAEWTAIKVALDKAKERLDAEHQPDGYNVGVNVGEHAGHELNTRGNRICKHEGIAVDLRVPGVSSDLVSDWVRANLPFDAIYLYTPDRPFHLSWSPTPRGTVMRMVPKKNGDGLVPRVVLRGRSGRDGRGTIASHAHRHLEHEPLAPERREPRQGVAVSAGGASGGRCPGAGGRAATRQQRRLQAD